MFTLILLALALSMDAFAAALSQGAAARSQATPGGALRIGLAFGAAQGIMPLLGWSIGLAFASVIRDVDHWVAFALLAFIGGRMIREGLVSRDDGASPRQSSLVAGWSLFVLAIATSIDAAAAGVTLNMLDQPVLTSCAVIGGVTLAMATAGVRIGRMAGAIVGRRAEVLGGVVLVAIGIKILVGHLYFGG